MKVNPTTLEHQAREAIAYLERLLPDLEELARRSALSTAPHAYGQGGQGPGPKGAVARPTEAAGVARAAGQVPRDPQQQAVECLAADMNQLWRSARAVEKHRAFVMHAGDGRRSPEAHR